MELVNEFSVQAPAERTWATVGDLRQVASCLPGAQIDRVETDETGAEVYHGRVAIKVGPIGLGLGGTATVVERDDQRYRMVVQCSARDSNGQGSADALITVTATAGADGSATDVRVVTDLGLGGRIAQFGSGMIKQVSGRIVKMFVRKLNALVLQPDSATDPAVGHPTDGQVGGVGPISQVGPVAPDGLPTVGGPAAARGGADLAAVGLAAAIVAVAAAVFGWSLGRTIGQFTAGQR